jgi:hypothetical protein
LGGANRAGKGWGAGAAGPVGGLLAAGFGFELGLLFQEAGVEGVKALAPMEFAGPIFEGLAPLAQVAGEGWKGAGVPELEVGHEGAKGTEGLVRKRVES